MTLKKSALLFLCVFPVMLVAFLTLSRDGARAAVTEVKYPTTEIVEASELLNITADATTVVKAGPGRIACITVNGGTMGAITVYDSLAASGTTIATVSAPYAGMVLPYGGRFKTGLTIVTADNTNITVSYQ